MLKEQLIKRVSELETKLRDSENWVKSILINASNLIMWRSQDFSRFSSMKNDKIECVPELFFEIWKLVEFRNNVLEDRNYSRDLENKTNQVEYLHQKLKDNNII